MSLTKKITVKNNVRDTTVNNRARSPFSLLSSRFSSLSLSLLSHTPYPPAFLVFFSGRGSGGSSRCQLSEFCQLLFVCCCINASLLCWHGWGSPRSRNWGLRMPPNPPDVLIEVSGAGQIKHLVRSVAGTLRLHTTITIITMPSLSPPPPSMTTTSRPHRHPHRRRHR